MSQRADRKGTRKLLQTVESETMEFSTADGENVRPETIKLCQTILPEDKSKLADVVDTVHRLDTRSQGDSKPKGVILQFTLQIYGDATWKAANASTFLRDNNLVGLLKTSRKERETVASCGKSTKIGESCLLFIGVRAFINRSEINLPP